MTPSAPVARTPGLRKITAIAAAGSFLDGFDLLIVNAALLTIVPAFSLSTAETGLLTSLPFVGMVVGALLAGRLCDTFGRRRVYLVDVLAFLVIALLIAAAQEYWQLLVLRLLLGVAIGADMPTGASMLAEIAPKKILGRLTAMMQTVWVFGGLVAAIVGYLLYQFAGDDSWRWMFFAAAVPAAIIAIARHNLPESPRWRAVSTTVSGASTSTARRSGIGTILRVRRYRRSVIFFTLYWGIESFLGGPPFIYTALIFSRVIEFSESEALLLSAALATLYVIANIVGQYVVLDRFGRKPIAVVICTVAGVAAIATGLLEDTALPLVITFGVFAVCTQVAPMPFWPWSVEQLPTRIRATGQSIGSSGGKLGQFVGLNIFTAGFITTMGWTTYFAFVGASFVLLAGYVVVRGQETKGTDLTALDSQDVELGTNHEKKG